MTASAGLILQTVLTIINYTDHKQRFVDSFLTLCISKTILELLNDLPDSIKRRVQHELNLTADPRTLLPIIEPYLSKQIYGHRLETVTSELFEDYIKTILLTLTPYQSAKLTEYLSSL